MITPAEKLYGDDRFLWSDRTLENYSRSLHYGPGLDALGILAQELTREISVVDVGAASGAFHDLMRRRCIPHRYTACDINRALLQKGAPYYGIEHMLQCDMRALPFPSGTFDAVVCYGTIFNVEEWERALSELFRIASTLVIANFLSPPFGSNSMRLKGTQPGQYVWVLNPGHFRTALEEAGLPQPDHLLAWHVPLNREADYPVFRGIDYRLERTAIWRLNREGNH